MRPSDGQCTYNLATKGNAFYPVAMNGIYTVVIKDPSFTIQPTATFEVKK